MKIITGPQRFDINYCSIYKDKNLGRLYKYEITSITNDQIDRRKDGSVKTIFFAISDQSHVSVLSAALGYLEDVGWLLRAKAVVSHVIVEE